MQAHERFVDFQRLMASAGPVQAGSIRAQLARSVVEGQRGAVAIVVAIFVVLRMILLAFVVDRGRVYVTQSQLQNGVDAASLAGAQAFCGGSGDPTTIAVNTGRRMGSPWIPTRVVVQRGTMSYINVPASTTVDLFFGPFVNTETVAVASQATAARSCIVNYRFVADTDVVFTGNSTDLRQVGIYAGECFYSTVPRINSEWSLSARSRPIR